MTGNYPVLSFLRRPMKGAEKYCITSDQVRDLEWLTASSWSKNRPINWSARSGISIPRCQCKLNFPEIERVCDLISESMRFHEPFFY